MIINYFKTASRRLLKEKVYVCINVLSLALGIASFLMISLYLRNELTYDRHYSNHDRIYRIVTSREEEKSAFSQIGIGPLLTQNYPQIGEYVRFSNSSVDLLNHDDNQFIWDRIFLTDQNVFDIFEHEILYGDLNTALSDPFSIAISESVAESYFGDQDPIGEILESPSQSFRVTLVFADLPENTHLKYDALIPFQFRATTDPTYEESYVDRLWGVHQYTYLFVPPEFDPNSFNELYNDFYELFMAERGRQLNSTMQSGLQPLASIHFGENLFRDQPNGNIFYVYAFSAVAIFILLVACINYVNLATARASNRVVEVGMRKVVGAKKENLIAQFLGESLIFTFGALIVGLILVELTRAFTPIGSIMGTEQLFQSMSNPMLITWVCLLALLVGIISGLYPAFYLSSISPLAAISKLRNTWRQGLAVRLSLIFLQLSVSIGVIASTITMSTQMNFIANTPLGFDKENRLLIQFRGLDAYMAVPSIERELLRQANILNVIDTPSLPGTESAYGGYGGEFESNDGIMNQDIADLMTVGLDYIDEMGIDIVDGRGFSEFIITDELNAVMVNESLVKKMGWEEPIGKRIGRGDDLHIVIGVVSDFHYAPLHNAIGPLVIWPDRDWGSNLIVNISGEDTSATLESIEATIREFVPDHVFEPTFLETTLDQAYLLENESMRLSEIFAGICIFISAIGLFGLTAYTTSQRYNEIGIRKVLGATSNQIIVLIVKYLIPLVLLAAVPASLISFYLLNGWLEKFAYRADLGFLPYLIATALVMAIALITVSIQSFNVSRSNLVEILRYE